MVMCVPSGPGTNGSIGSPDSTTGFRTRTLSAAPMHEAFLYDEKHHVQCIAERTSGKDRGIHVSDIQNLLGIYNPMPEAVFRTDEHFCNDDDDKCHANAAAQSNESLRQAFPNEHILEYLPSARAHDLRRHDALLARVHDAVGAVEKDDQDGGERSDRNLVYVAHAENHHEERN